MSKPSPAQIALMLTAVTNNGYLTADLHRGRTARTLTACMNNDWFTTDGRITYTGRNALHQHDAQAYADALPAEHVDYELTRLTHAGVTLPPAAGPLGSTAHVLAIPDAFIQYDVKPETVGRYVGYNITTSKGLRVIMHVEYIRDGDYVIGAQIFLSDSKGDVEYAGTIYTEAQVYGPAGNPDLRQESADLLNRTRHAYQQMTAGKFLPVTVAPAHTNPNTEHADSIVLADDVAAITETTAAETGARYAAAMAPTVGTWKPASPAAIRDMLTTAITEMNRRQTGTGKTQHTVNPFGQVVPVQKDSVWGVTTSGKTGVTFYPEEAEQVLTGAPGKSYEKLLQLLRASRDDRIHVIDPKTGSGVTPLQSFNRADLEQLASINPAPIQIAYNHGPVGRGVTRALSPSTLARMEKTRAGFSATLVNPATRERLTPAVDPGPLRVQVEQLRDQIVAIVGDMDGIAGDVTATGYRINLHLARISTTSERARDALMKLETALSEIERGAHRVARVILSRAVRQMNRK